MSCSLYWVQIGPRTVVSLRGLRAFYGDPILAAPPKPAASRLVIEPGLIFDLDDQQAERVWIGVEKVYALEGVVPTLNDPDGGHGVGMGGVPREEDSKSTSGEAGPDSAVFPSFKPKPTGNIPDAETTGSGPGIVG